MIYQKTPRGREVEYTSPTGKKTTLYNIGVLAEALGRTSQTIRKWEIWGVIPPTPFKTKEGKRLYSKEHIDAIVKCAESSHIMQGSNISSTVFAKKVYKEFQKVNDYFFKEDKKDGSESKED